MDNVTFQLAYWHQLLDSFRLSHARWYQSDFFCGEGGERRRAEGSSGAPREALRKVRPPQRGFSRGYAPGFFLKFYMKCVHFGAFGVVFWMGEGRRKDTLASVSFIVIGGQSPLSRDRSTPLSLPFLCFKIHC